MRKKCSRCCLVLMFITASTVAQDTTVQSSFSISFYADAYLAYYTDSLGIDDYQKFPSISPRSEHFGLNVASFSAKYASDRVRSTVAFHYGDVPRSTWSTTFNFIQEANAGLRLCKNFWLDAGFFRTHVGTEGLFPRENITSSVAVATFFEPYYEAGLRLSYAPSEKLALNLFALNGYNLFEDNNKKKSLGVLATYAFSDHLSMGYDNYIGDDGPDEDSISHVMFYNNVFLNFEKNKIKIITGGDFCIHRNASVSNPDKSATLFSGVFAIRYMAAKKFNVYARAEIYHDPSGFLSGASLDKNNHLTGLKLWGVTVGVEFRPTDNSYIRLEGRELIADDAQEIFYSDRKPTNQRSELLLNIGVWFP